jgi:hypothetical protein
MRAMRQVGGGLCSLSRKQSDYWERQIVKYSIAKSNNHSSCTPNRINRIISDDIARMLKNAATNLLLWKTR